MVLEEQDYKQIQPRMNGVLVHTDIKQNRKRRVMISAPNLKRVPPGLKEKRKKKKSNETPHHWIEVESTKPKG